MVASFAVVRQSSYYTNQSAAAYYEASGESVGTWLRGHERLGVERGEAVTAGDFDRVCAGIDASGQRLIPKISSKMLGVDLTLSSPKSVSVLWAFGDEDTKKIIATAEHQAVEAVLDLIEQEIPLARRGRDGLKHETARFTAAVFTHSESRPERHADWSIYADPQRHHHLCIPSIGERADGSWGGLNSVALRSWKKTIGAHYRLALATALQREGFAIEADDGDWKWSIGGVPKNLCRLFSARRASLEEELAADGTNSKAAPALAASLAASNRKAKQPVSSARLGLVWAAAASQHGYDAKAVVASAYAAGKLQSAALTPKRCQLLAEQRIAAIPAGLTERNSTFERRQVLESVANALVGTRISAHDVASKSDGLLTSNRITELGESRDGVVYSTPAMIAIERELCTVAKRLAAGKVSSPDRVIVRRLTNQHGLNQEQVAIVEAATAGLRLTLVQGGAGTGKSTALKAITEAWQSAGYTVVGAAVAWRAAHILRDDLAIEARAIDSWVALSEVGDRVFGHKHCLIIEEAGLQSSRQALRLIQAIEDAGGVCILVGDENQLKPIGAGHAMRIVREAVGASEISQVVRQHEEWARQAPTDFARGDAEKALAAFEDRGLIRIEQTAKAAALRLVREWDEVRRASTKLSSTIIAKTNAEVRALASAVRTVLRSNNVLQGPDYPLPAVDASGNGYTLNLAKGDRIRFLVRDDRLGIVNGSEAEIIDIHLAAGSKNLCVTARKDRETIIFDTADLSDQKGRVKLAIAYATTLFQAQGITVDKAFVLLSSRFDRHDAYVASSRARETTTFFLDERSLASELTENQSDRGSDPPRALLIEHLAKRLARTSVKTTTLDLLTQPQDRVEEKAHRREFEHEL